jgi:hypothetical protein
VVIGLLDIAVEQLDIGAFLRQGLGKIDGKGGLSGTPFSAGYGNNHR